MRRMYTYLALGDSYTIGESVLLYHSFPYQLMHLLREQGFECAAPEIVARTGWTTGELEAGMKPYDFLPRYDFVSLLIGVNNQYRGMDIIKYKEEFEALLKRAIALAHGKAPRVFVLSIPDYSVTPFAQEKNKEKIAKDIDAYNSLNKALSIQYKVHYIDITEESRKAGTDPELIAADRLHPSAKAYAQWAGKLAQAVIRQIKK